jgi:hypothetical protein
MKIFCHLMDVCAPKAYHVHRKPEGNKKWHDVSHWTSWKADWEVQQTLFCSKGWKAIRIAQTFSDLRKALLSWSQQQQSRNQQNYEVSATREVRRWGQDIDVLTSMLGFVLLHVSACTTCRQSTSDSQTDNCMLCIYIYIYIYSTVNNFMDWPHSGAVMHYSGYVEPQDGAIHSSLIPATSSCLCAVYSEGKSLLWRVVVSERWKSRM